MNSDSNDNYTDVSNSKTKIDEVKLLKVKK